MQDCLTSGVSSTPTGSALPRHGRLRQALRHAVCVALGGAALGAAVPASAQSVVHSFRPSVPYRVWYGANTSMSEMTLATAGNGDPRALEAEGIIELGWAYGTQIDWEAGPQYWIDRCDAANRTYAANSQYPYDYVIAGIGLDEWVGSKYPDTPQWIQDGLRVGKDDNPEIFIANWANGWGDEEMYEMGLDNTIDLYITQGYTRAPSPGLADAWYPSVREVETLAERGLITKTVLSLGHITDLPHHSDGSVWTEAELRDKMEYLKEQYPNMPGIAFFPGSVGDPGDYQDLVDLCNDLAKEYWPDNWVPDGVYAITPQQAPWQRLDAYGYGTTNGDDVGLWTAKYPSDLRNQQWRFINLGNNVYRIEPAYSDDVCLDVSGAANSNGAKVQLWTSNNTNAQKWKLVPVHGGFLIEPLCAPGKYLRLNGTGNGTLADIWQDQQNGSQVFALTPEICSTDKIPPYYQAESATLAGGCWVGTYGWSHTGTGYVNFNTNSNGETVTFNNVDGNDGGACDLVFRYTQNFGGTRSVNLTVNGSTSQITFPSTGNWANWLKLTVTRNLNPGPNNTIVITTTGQDPGDIDKMTVVPAS